MSSSEAALNKQKEDQEAQELDIGEFKLKIEPRCLTFNPKSYHKPAAYTSDGFMLPCCWLDDPKNDFGVEYFGLKDEHLRVRNVDKLEFFVVHLHLRIRHQSSLALMDFLTYHQILMAYHIFA